MNSRDAKKILRNNLAFLDKLSRGQYQKSMPNTCHYLLSNNQKLLKVIRNLYEYLLTKSVFVNDEEDPLDINSGKANCYYFSDSKKFAYGISNASRSVAQGYRELLSAIGMLCRVDLGVYLKLNRNQRNRMKMVTYLFEMWDDEKLQEFEQNATRLKEAGVNKSNIGSAYLLLHGLEDIKEKILPLNSVEPVIEAKNRQFIRFDEVVSMLIDSQGYASNTQIAYMMELTQKQYDNFRRLFKDRIGEKYHFHRPTKAEQQQYGLTTIEYIYTPLDTDKQSDTQQEP